MTENAIAIENAERLEYFRSEMDREPAWFENTYVTLEYKKVFGKDRQQLNIGRLEAERQIKVERKKRSVGSRRATQVPSMQKNTFSNPSNNNNANTESKSDMAIALSGSNHNNNKLSASHDTIPSIEVLGILRTIKINLDTIVYLQHEKGATEPRPAIQNLNDHEVTIEQLKSGIEESIKLITTNVMESNHLQKKPDNAKKEHSNNKQKFPDVDSSLTSHNSNSNAPGESFDYYNKMTETEYDSYKVKGNSSTPSGSGHSLFSSVKDNENNNETMSHEESNARSPQQPL